MSDWSPTLWLPDHSRAFTSVFSMANPPHGTFPMEVDRADPRSSHTLVSDPSWLPMRCTSLPRHDPTGFMTSRPFTSARRPTTHVRETHAERTRFDRGAAEPEFDAEDKGVHAIATLLLGLTIIGAVAMLGFRWTMS